MIPQDEFMKYATKHMGMSTMHLENYAQAIGGMAGPQVTGFSPNVIEERQRPASVLDVFSRLMMDRIIFMGVQVTDYVANVVQAQLLFLESVDPKQDVQMFINSPGGSVIAGMGMYDTMNYVTPHVATICTGLAASMGSLLLAAGEPGKRSILPHARVMIHQPSGGMQGQFSDMEINYQLISKLREELYNIYVKHTGQTFETIEKSSDRDNWMTAPEAVAYGLVDEVLVREKAGEKK
ncbi:ClpP family protease [Neolewinella antarctica]|uniref:ATP-dependent Clp protease proteolytic subunit n=1 Tax=Neolewinella antarctica TaxID=442734 RepID=A0ABX0XE03_9BACT|nr:ATP-dependent Clp protease proteolytic subunit [Neolewinella antarctica]NJC27133.1 ATP-dependent Clp protease protease subunit [Neolewinella antarctica]